MGGSRKSLKIFEGRAPEERENSFLGGQKYLKAKGLWEEPEKR